MVYIGVQPTRIWHSLQGNRITRILPRDGSPLACVHRLRRHVLQCTVPHANGTAYPHKQSAALITALRGDIHHIFIFRIMQIPLWLVGLHDVKPASAFHSFTSFVDFQNYIHCRCHSVDGDRPKAWRLRHVLKLQQFFLC